MLVWTNQTASSHLNELVNADLLYRRKCGRFHYYEISNESVASFIEQIASGIPVKSGCDSRRRVKPELKKARFCYDHLAGELGVEISRILVQMGGPDSQPGQLPSSGDRTPGLPDNRC